MLYLPFVAGTVLATTCGSPVLQDLKAVLEEAAARPLIPASQQSQLVQQAADTVFGDMQLVENHPLVNAHGFSVHCIRFCRNHVSAVGNQALSC